jgi:hypothetical protein
MPKMSKQLGYYRAEDVTLDYPAEIWKQSAIAEVEEPEHELKNRVMMVLKWTE